MTNELAIRILTGDVLSTTEQTQEAIEMAVKALSNANGETIYRQDAINLLKKWSDGYAYIDTETESAIKDFQHFPSAQPERKHGRWEMLQMPISPPVYKCSVCGSHALQSMTGCLMNRHYEANLTNYCPNCGARMEK